MLVLLITCSNVLAQQLTIRGTVTDQRDGAPFTGAYVMVQGTGNVVLTDVDGNYEIKASAGNVLEFSFMGYVTQSVSLDAASQVIDVVMEEELTSIDAVVAVGYGVTKKKLVTGANLNVSGDEVTKLNTTTAMEALQGIAPGLAITKNSSAPGAGTKVYIRGIGTVGSSTPLYVVDGVQCSGIDNINPANIESIDVLKDAASAAIYGSRAANGVILVTTKKGRQNQKTQVSYSGYVGFQNLATKPSTLNAQEYMAIWDEAYINGTGSAYDWYGYLTNNPWLESQQSGLGVEYGEYIWNKLENGWEGTDWLDEIVTENARIDSHSITINGGGSKTTYSLGVGYYAQQGLIGYDIMGASYERFNVSLNTDMILFADSDGRPIVTIGENFNYTNSSNVYVGTGGQYYNDAHNALKTNPLMPAYWDGSLDETGIAPTTEGISSTHDNPIMSLYYKRGQFSDNNSNNIIGNAYINIEPIKNLVIRSSFGLSGYFSNNRSYTPTNSGFGSSNNASPVIEDEVTQSMSLYGGYTWTNTISWNKDFGKHSISLLGGHEVAAAIVNAAVSASRTNSLYDDFAHAYINNTETAADVTDVSVSGYDYAAQGGGTLSYMGRASYSYDDKYMVDFTMRADASSAFAEGNQWGYFPSVSAGWNFSEESWMKDLDFISFAKLRGSWGQNGNSTLQSSDGSSVSFAYSSNVTTTTDGTGYYFGDDRVVASTASYPSTVPNPDLTWETSEQLNFGLDLRFFNSRLGVTFDWYQKITRDWLVEAPIIGTSGASAPFVNGGEIMNAGTELSISWNDTKGDFSYGATFSFFTNDNEVLSLESETGYINGPTDQCFDGSGYINRVEVGMPIGYFYGYKTDGILQNQDEVDAWVNEDGVAYFDDAQPGDVRFVDVNGDGVIDDNDKTMIGDPNADFQIGLQLNFAYKGAYLNITGTGKFGHQVFNTYFWGNTASGESMRNWTTEIFNRWTGEGTSNYLPRLVANGHRNSSYVSDLYVYDADFFRISNLTIGYDFSYLFPKENWISNVTLYLSANNLITFTEYDGYDPDVAYGGTGCSWGSGVDLGLYPAVTTYMIGLNLTF
ncbi:MAG: TonB-dependent receptor [Rikenellaceae bacterium]